MATSEQNSDQKRSGHSWLRRALVLLFVLCIYRLIIWGILHSVDLKRLKSEMEDWAHGRLYTDVSIRDMQVDLDIFGHAQITASDLEVANPDMVSFAGNLFSSRKLSVGCPVWGLWGFRVKPNGTITGAHLVLDWNEQGDSNLRGLGKALDSSLKRVNFPFGRLNARTFFFDLKRCKVSIHRAQQHQRLVLELNGKIIYDIRKRKAWGNLASSTVSGILNSKSAPLSKTTVKFHRFSCKTMSELDRLPRILAVDAEFASVPVAALRVLWPGLPVTGPSTMISGKVQWDQPDLRISGTVQGLRITGLGIKHDCAFRIKCSTATPAPLRESFCALLGSEANPAELLRAVVIPGKPADPPRLKLACKRLSLGILPPVMAGIPGWLRTIVAGFSRIEIEARATRLEGLPGIISGLALGGSLTAVITRHPQPSGQENATHPLWSVILQISDISLQANSGGDIIRELAGLPLACARLTAFSRKTMNIMPKTPAPAMHPIQLLHLSKLTVDYKVFPDGGLNIVVDGLSPEIGRITGGGQLKPTAGKKTVTGNAFICLRQIPQDLFKTNGAAPEVLLAIRRQAGTAQGMRIDITFSEQGSRINRRYLQDAFMILTKIIGEKHK